MQRIAIVDKGEVVNIVIASPEFNPNGIPVEDERAQIGTKVSRGKFVLPKE